MIRKKYKNEFALAIITVSVVGLTVLFNDVNLQLRIKEIRIFLQSFNRDDNNLDHISLVMKYRHQKEMYENKISDVNVSIVENRVNSILSMREKKTESFSEKYKYMTVPVLYTTNILRRIIGVPPINDIKEDELNLNLEVAYYYERNRNYQKAIGYYDRILIDPATGRALTASVLLHEGFCYSIMGDYNDARTRYLAIIKDYGELQVAITAAVLLRYLDGFVEEIERIIKTERDSVEKSEKLFKLIAYAESYKVIRRIEKTASASERKRIQFLKGRIYEETGETGKALKIYQQIIRDNPKSEYAASSNRRIYLIGSLIQGGDRIKKLAIDNNRMIKDKTIPEMIKEESKFIIPENKNNYNIEPGSSSDILVKNASSGNSDLPVESESIDVMLTAMKEKVSKEKRIKKIGKEQKPLPHDKKQDEDEEVNVKVFTDKGDTTVELWLENKQTK